MEWYQRTIEETQSVTKTSELGLSSEERQKRIVSQGENSLSKGQEDSELKKFLHHFNDLLIYVLIGAGILKGVTGDFIDMTIIFAVVLINSLIGYVQERKATNSLSSLSAMMGSQATILADGEKGIVEATSLVVGDVVLLNPGTIIPADLRLVEAYNLVVEEAILTGESTPVNKNTADITSSADLGDRLNMVYSGTLVNSGSGKGIVVETGDGTELGKISQHLKEVGSGETPLIKKMKQLNKQIFYILAALISFLVVFSLMFREFTGGELVSAMIALAVSAVPEGLPAVLSIILSVGVTRMAVKKAIIKKMPAVETLGSMSVICSDKTGTLTKNEMTVVSIVTKDQVVEIADEGFEHSAQEDRLAWHRLIETALYCNDTKINYRGGKREIIGNPTEGALLELANQHPLDQEEHILHKIPFDSAYKYMATLVVIGKKKFIYLKGAPDIVLDMVSLQLEQEAYTTIDLAYWEEEISIQARKGQRMLAAAYKEVPFEMATISHEDLQQEMVMLGLYGIIDPPKKEAMEAIQICHDAGISVKMITGDHKDTAVAIAEQIGLTNYNQALIGSDIENLSDLELQGVVATHDVFARTTPEHKLRLVRAIQENGEIVGMTGDGVNDAPALKKADIGIAMGIKGTEVTKGAADMVLADDNFATIAAAVREGRRVYDNLKKTIYFSLPTAFAQGLLVVVSILLDKPLPLTSIQILWLNMVTTITLSFALGFEPIAKDAMTRKPRDPKENILNGYAVFRTTYVSLLLAALGFMINTYLGNQGASETVMQTTLLLTIVCGQVFYMINCREIHQFAITKSILANKILWLATGILVILQLAVMYVPFMNSILATTSIGWHHTSLALLAGVLVFLIVEGEKLIYRIWKKI